jgi:F5/8 type C domain
LPACICGCKARPGFVQHVGMLVRALAVAVAAVAASFGLLGCGGSSGDRILRFSAVEVGKTVVQVAPDGRSAVVRIRTDPPTVCAIAYGTTASLGSIANDPSMGGHAISRHSVVLGGLTPNTSYRFRLTATDAQGRVFQTPGLATFKTTPSRTASAGRDLALRAKVVAVSSQYGGDYTAANAVDGNLATEWSSAGDGNKASITIDLGAERKIGGVAFLTREMSDGSAITRTFAVVVDGGRRYGPFPAGSRVNPRVARVSFTGRRLRFEVVTSTGGNTGAAEIEVLAP